MTIKSSKESKATRFNPVHWFKPLCLLLIALVVGTLKFCWNGLAFLINLVDGGEDDSDDSSSNNRTWYNHRTGEVDPFKRFDGWYDDE